MWSVGFNSIVRDVVTSHKQSCKAKCLPLVGGCIQYNNMGQLGSLQCKTELPVSPQKDSVISITSPNPSGDVLMVRITLPPRRGAHSSFLRRLPVRGFTQAVQNTGPRSRPPQVYRLI